MTTHLVWFRHDLRIHDNPALAAACRDKNARVIGLFVATPGQWHQHDMSPRQAWYLWRHVEDLRCSLAQKGIELQVSEVADFDASIHFLGDICRKNKVAALFYNYQYPVNERKRDAGVERLLTQQGVVCQGFDASVILPPGSVTTQDGGMYRVFTPYSKACVRRLTEGVPECIPAPAPRAESTSSESVKPFDYPMEPVDEHRFPVGEAQALARLRHFCRQQAADYPKLRDIPAEDGTSLLSAWLAIGVLSPRQCLQRLLAEHPDALAGETGWTWLNELLWRDFYCHLMVAWPKLCRYQPFQAWTQDVAWRTDSEAFSLWQQGKTGFPIVDAAMRQLNETGWMHNRLRMICASFLTKDLLIDWRQGERYFMRQLVDGDLASNNGGWQWAASTGTDAAPYFRIFNPTAQGKKFDPQGAFIRRWLPELTDIPDNAIHEPWKWAEKTDQNIGYPQPCVDHQQARRATLDAWEKAKKRSRK